MKKKEVVARWVFPLSVCCLIIGVGFVPFSERGEGDFVIAMMTFSSFGMLAVCLFHFIRLREVEKHFSDEPPEEGQYQIAALFPSDDSDSFFELMLAVPGKDETEIKHYRLPFQLFCSPPTSSISINEGRWLKVVAGGHLKITHQDGEEMVGVHARPSAPEATADSSGSSAPPQAERDHDDVFDGAEEMDRMIQQAAQSAPPTAPTKG